MQLSDITPLVVTRNEEPNIGRTLERLNWATRVVVVDSFSTDRTAEIAQGFLNATFLQREFDNHAAHWNFALQHAFTEWVFALDADYGVTDEVVAELRSLQPASDVAAYEASFTYVIRQRRLRGSLYPPKPVLLRRSAVHFVQDGHTQRPVIRGRVERLSNPILHEDRKPFHAFVESQQRYMALEAEKIRSTPFLELSWPARVRKLLVVAPPAAFFYTLIGRRTILDGLAGLEYAFQRFVAESILSAKLIRRDKSHTRATK